MTGHFIVCGAQIRVAGRLTVLSPVDELSRVFDAGADREGFLHHLDALLIEHGDGVPGGMSERQDDAVGLKVHC